MPLYEYLCETCGEHFEVIQKFADAPVAVHEKCGGKVHRLLSAPALQFKGSGWYITDYAKGGDKPGNGSSKKSESSTSSTKSGTDSGNSSGSSTSGSESKSTSSSDKT